MAFLDNTDFIQMDKQPIAPSAPAAPNDAWSWLIQFQDGVDAKGKANTAEQFVQLDGYVVSKANIPYLVFADKDTGKITEDSVISEDRFISNILRGAISDPATIKRLQLQLKRAGFLGADYNANGTLDNDGTFITKLVEAARLVSAQNLAIATDPTGKAYTKTQPIIFEDWLKKATAGKSGYSTTSVSKSITSFSNAEARGILESFYADALGRRPSDAEVKKFNKVINTAARSNPDITTTTYGGGNQQSTATTGYTQADAQLKARDIAESQVGASGYMTSTKYMDAFLGALGGRMGGA